MTRREALEITRGIRISDSEDDLCFKAMVIFWIGANYRYDKTKTAKTTKYSEDEVGVVINNWEKCGILVDGVIHGEFDGESDWMEVILISMCGGGEIIRVDETYGTPNKTEIMEPRKTLNEHLFDTLERLSSADNDNIDAEMNKAASIISVSEQILNVARLKLDIIQISGEVGGQFSEIDVITDRNVESKKKLH